MTLPVVAGKNGLASILRFYKGNPPITEEELQAWVLDGGTRFVPPQNEYDDDGDIKEVSAERKLLTDEDVRRALPMLGGAVDIDLAYCAPLTDAIITEIGNRCPSLKTLDVRCASPRAPPLPARARLSLTRASPRAPPALRARAPLMLASPPGPVRVIGGASR